MGVLSQGIPEDDAMEEVGGLTVRPFLHQGPAQHETRLFVEPTHPLPVLLHPGAHGLALEDLAPPERHSLSEPSDVPIGATDGVLEGMDVQ